MKSKIVTTKSGRLVRIRYSDAATIPLERALGINLADEVEKFIQEEIRREEELERLEGNKK